MFRSDNLLTPSLLCVKVDGVSDTWDMVMERGAAKNIMLVPGKLFAPSEDVMLVRFQLIKSNVIVFDWHRGLSYKKRRLKRPKVSNVNSEFGTFHIVAKCPKLLK